MQQLVQKGTKNDFEKMALDKSIVVSWISSVIYLFPGERFHI